ncbi:MAG TPA: hypothetical protein VFB16_00290 [Bauldia sp.]|nr:hypothetical protein [Bauldia sp.]
MAEYYAVLKKAVGSLDGNAADARRAVYDKARNALIGQLKAVDPPLTTAEISRQRLELEEAIRKVEREAASAPSSPPVARPANPPIAIALPRAEPPPPPPPPASTPPVSEMPADGGPSPQDVFRRAIQEAEQRGNAAGAIDRAPPPAYRQEYASGAATAADLRPRNLPVRDDLPPPRRPEPPYQPPATYDPPRPANEPRLVPDYAPEWDQPAPAPTPSIQPSPFLDSRDRPLLTKRKRGYLEDDDRKLYERAATARKSRLPAILLTVLILAVLGGVAALGWANRDKLADLMKSFTSGNSATASKPVTPVAVDTSNKNSDRLPDAATPAAPTTDVRVVTPAPASAPVEPATANPPAATAADQATPPGTDTVTDVAPPAPIAEAPAAPALAATPAPASGDALVAQKAILYEEPVDASAAASGVVAINAAVTWRFVETGPNGPEIEASLQVPERNMKVRLTIHKNADTSLPASHLIEVVVDTPPDFPGKGIKSVPRLVLKPTEEARGQPLVGAPAKVTDGFFWIALSSAQEDVDANLALMRERNWIDLPFVYETGQRAILTFEKGTPGERVFEKAAAAWSGQAQPG